MGDPDLARLVYLAIIVIALLGWFIAQARASFNKTLQHAATWGLIFLGVIAAVGLWQDISQTVAPRQMTLASGQAIEVPRHRDGHYYLTLVINDAPIRFVVDTGATNMVLTAQDARLAGFDPDQLNYFARANTANGQVQTAPVILERVALGGIVDQNVRATVNAAPMGQSLLGMGYLERWGQIEISSGYLRLSR
jgi:aspartyl protease family protein